MHPSVAQWESKRLIIVRHWIVTSQKDQDYYIKYESRHVITDRLSYK